MPVNVAEKYQTVESVAGLTFAVENGSAGEEVIEGLGFANKTEVATQADAVMEVSAGPAAAEEDDDPPFDPDEPPAPAGQPAAAAELPEKTVEKPRPVPEYPEDPVVSDAAPSAADVDSLDDELFSFDEKPQPKRLTVVVRVDPNAQPGSSGRRIRRLHGLVSSYPGRDRFAFMIIENGKIYLVDYPDIHTNVCDELIRKLSEQVGTENVQVEEPGKIGTAVR